MITFAFMPAYNGDEREALLLARNLAHISREWDSCHSPVLILHAEHKPPTEKFLDAIKNLPVELIPFRVPEAFREFPYAAKVFAAAEAERRANSPLLVWLDSDTLILQPPDEFLLSPHKMMAGCPVHLKNISSLSEKSIDDFWGNIYLKTPADRIFNVTTRVDKVSVRAHFNAGSLVVRPKTHLLSAWKERFEGSVLSDTFTPYYQQHPLYAIFIHQAILSAVVMEHFTEREIALLPEGYNYPVFLQSRFSLIPPTQIITLRYDQFSFFESQNLKDVIPAWLEDALRETL